MKLLLDENLPKRLRLDFPEHETQTVREAGWNGETNGELLGLMIANGFDVLMTFDKNLEHQHNFLKYPVVVVVLSAASNQYKHLSELSPSVREFLREATPGVTVIRPK